MYALIATVGIALLLAGLVSRTRGRKARHGGQFYPTGVDGSSHHQHHHHHAHHGDLGGGAHHGGFGGGHHGGFGGGGHHG